MFTADTLGVLAMLLSLMTMSYIILSFFQISVQFFFKKPSKATCYAFACLNIEIPQEGFAPFFVLTTNSGQTG